MPINLKGDATNAARELAVAFKDGSTEAIEQAFTVFQDEIAEQLADEYVAAQGDRTILAQRGFRQLTTAEMAYFTAVGEALASPTPQQAFAVFDTTQTNGMPAKMMPETEINEIFKDLVERHELLSVIGMTNTGYQTTWLRNKHSRQFAVWGSLSSAISQEITSAWETITITQNKLSCYAAVSRDMLALGPTWLEAYVRTVMGEAWACGLEKGALTGNGIGGQPIGLDRNLAGSIDQSTGYPKKTAVAVTDFSPASYGALVASLAKTDDNKVKQSISGLTLVCNLTDYLTKIMPATTVLNNSGQYVNGLFPVPTRVITSEFVDSNEAILFLAPEYEYFVGGVRGIEYSDEFQFLNDMRYFKLVSYAYGMPRWNTSSARLDTTNLDPAYITVKVAGTVTTASETTASSDSGSGSGSGSGEGTGSGS